ncbi:MAG: hypothetical protein PVF54_01070 [Anaerolineae bacterium]
MKVTKNNHRQAFGLWERTLRSWAARGVFRIHVGWAFVRSWAMGTQSPRGASIHLFDYLLYRSTDRGEPFEEWVGKRELLSA